MAAKNWDEEFRNELIDDHRALLEAQAHRKKSGTWSFAKALERTRIFYRERLTGFARCGSISEKELETLMLMVEQMGTEEFPA